MARVEALQREIDRLTKQGYQVIQKTDNTAEMNLPTPGYVFWGITTGGLLFFLYNVLRRMNPRRVTLYLDEQGRVRKRFGRTRG